MIHVPDGAKWFLLTALLVLMLPRLAFATPFVFIDTNNGDDASLTPYMPNTPVRTYARVIEIMYRDGVDTVGVKLKPGSALPTAEQAMIINDRKIDRKIIQTNGEIIPGHGSVPTRQREESSEAGLAIVNDWVWETFVAPNGQLAERHVNIVSTVEEF